MSPELKKKLLIAGGIAAALAVGITIYKIVKSYNSSHASKEDKDILLDAAGTADDAWYLIQKYAQKQGKPIPDSVKKSFFDTFNRLTEAQRVIFLEEFKKSMLK